MAKITDKLLKIHENSAYLFIAITDQAHQLAVYLRLRS
jgi:hypothetical protein